MVCEAKARCVDVEGYALLFSDGWEKLVCFVRTNDHAGLAGEMNNGSVMIGAAELEAQMTAREHSTIAVENSKKSRNTSNYRKHSVYRQYKSERATKARYKGPIPKDQVKCSFNVGICWAP